LLLSVPLVLQNAPRCLRRLCNQTTILSWPRLACLKLTGYLSKRSSSWLTAFLHGFCRVVAQAEGRGSKQ
jgi:hypothetical protein